MTLRVTIVGVGGLGSAIAQGLVDAVDVDLTLCARRAETVAAFADRARIVANASSAVAGADVVVVAVKPKDVVAVLQQLAPALASNALVVSCAAGVGLDTLAAALTTASVTVGLARAMPNIGARVKASTTAVVLGSTTSATRDHERLEHVFGAVGTVKSIVDEQQLHAITAVAASAPAWLLLAVEALVDGAVEQGISRADALVWARGALVAAAARLDDGVEPLTVRAQVTSPAGTTAAGLAVLEEAGVRSAIQRAVAAASSRSRTMG
jgi:pyrroline-5-carboxylate reductase